ncbi:MAG: FtsQ-type POTRA domain-containing protein [Anaerolineae bacterium]
MARKETKRRPVKEQEFLTKPRKPRRRPATRQMRQEQTVARALPQLRRPTLPRVRISAVRVVAFVVLATLIALTAYLFSSPVFFVQTAAIRGLQHATAEEVYRLADVDQYSIFWLDTRAAEQRIESLPYVKQATVAASLPNEVRIEVVERAPLVVWNVGGNAYWADAEGVAMPIADPAQVLPVLWDLDGSTITPDGHLNEELIASVSQLKTETPDVSEFGYDRNNGLQFRLPGGTFVYLGQPQGMTKRTASLLLLQKQLASEDAMPAEIDWRDEDGYFIRLAQ